MTATPHIRILMCTYNGATYLRDQLQSIAAQSHSDWSLWVSDDGSSDDTLDQLEAFHTGHPQRDIQVFTGPRTGAADNYLSLLQRLTPTPNELVALADQDDVWFPDKLSRAAQAMAHLHDDIGVYGAAQVISDSTLTRHRPSKPCPSGPSFRNALVQNILSGSTLVLNDRSITLLQNTMPRTEIPFHDWWIYQILTGAGGVAIYDPDPSVHYRQHNQNLLGGSRGRNAILRRVRLLGKSNFRRWIDQNVAALTAAKASLSPQNQDTLAAFIAARKKPRSIRAAALKRVGIHRQARKETATLLGAATLGRL